MSPDEVCQQLDRAVDLGCVEALLCLGDTPERHFPTYAKQLAGWGFDETVAYLDWISRQALKRGLLPHTNAGILDVAAMAQLRQTNVSMGLMLESNSSRLCAPGMPHFRAPDKEPGRRRTMLRQAGELRIPFTSGVLVGIGETREERMEALDVLVAAHRLGGHLQEVIVQPFRPHAQTGMARAPEASLDLLLDTVAEARCRLPAEVSVQAPPNLAPGAIEALIEAGINDFGGLSALTPDYINPRHAWPHVEALAARCADLGFELQPRLPVYDRYIREAGWLDAGLCEPVQQALTRAAA